MMLLVKKSNVGSYSFFFNVDATWQALVGKEWYPLPPLSAWVLLLLSPTQREREIWNTNQWSPLKLIIWGQRRYPILEGPCNWFRKKAKAPKEFDILEGACSTIHESDSQRSIVRLAVNVRKPISRLTCLNKFWAARPPTQTSRLHMNSLTLTAQIISNLDLLIILNPYNWIELPTANQEYQGPSEISLYINKHTHTCWFQFSLACKIFLFRYHHHHAIYVWFISWYACLWWLFLGVSRCFWWLSR